MKYFLSDIRKESNRMFKRVTEVIRTPRGKILLVLSALFLILIGSFTVRTLGHNTNQKSENSPSQSPTAAESTTPTVAITGHLSVSPTISPTVIPSVQPSQTSTQTNTQTQITQTQQSSTPTQTPAPSMQTITVQNGSDFSFTIGYDSQNGTPPGPEYSGEYVDFYHSGITNPNYKIGDYVEEIFHFTAIKSGETIIGVQRHHNSGGTQWHRYKIIIQ